MKLRISKAWEAEHYHEKATFGDCQLLLIVRNVEDPAEEGRGIAVQFMFPDPHDAEGISHAWQRAVEAIVDANPEMVKHVWKLKHDGDDDDLPDKKRIIRV